MEIYIVLFIIVVVGLIVFYFNPKGRELIVKIGDLLHIQINDKNKEIEKKEEPMPIIPPPKKEYRRVENSNPEFMSDDYLISFAKKLQMNSSLNDEINIKDNTEDNTELE